MKIVPVIKLRDDLGRFLPKSYLTIWIVLGLFAIAGLLALLANLTNFISRNNIIIQKPYVAMIDIIRQPIVVIEPRKELIVMSPIGQTVTEPVNIDNLSDIEEEILRVFGEQDFKVARAIAKAESGLREHAFHANDNGSIDLGVFQINSVHYNKEGCSMNEVVTYKGNIKCAYSIYKEQGFSPWVAYTSKSFVPNLD